MTYGIQSIDQFLESVASENVTPAAGSVNAIVGAAGASLLQMVCLHSRSADCPAEVLAELEAIGDELRERRGHLLELAEAVEEIPKRSHRVPASDSHVTGTRHSLMRRTAAFLLGTDMQPYRILPLVTNNP